MQNCKYFTNCCLFYFIIYCDFFQISQLAFQWRHLHDCCIMLYSKFYVEENQDSDVLITKSPIKQKEQL